MLIHADRNGMRLLHMRQSIGAEYLPGQTSSPHARPVSWHAKYQRKPTDIVTP
jgi:hypothetical protein